MDATAAVTGAVCASEMETPTDPDALQKDVELWRQRASLDGLAKERRSLIADSKISKMESKAEAESKIVKSRMKVAGMRKTKFNNTNEVLDLTGSCWSKIWDVVIRRVAQLSWLLVILGTELDVIGFLIATFTYYDMFDYHSTDPKDPDEYFYGWVVRGFLVYGPLGYCFAIKIYTEVQGSIAGKVCFGVCLSTIGKEITAAGKVGMDKEQSDTDTATRIEALNQVSDAVAAEAQEKSSLSAKLLAAEDLDTHIEPRYLRLHLFHFIPLFRSYILVKNMVPDDVEALFRVNGLSTFTLGVSQMVSMTLGFSKGKLKLNGLVWFGIIAQACNLFVTFLYFATPIPGVLMNQSAIEAIENASREVMQAQFYRFENAIAQCSDHGDKENVDGITAKQVLADLHTKLNDEIFARSQLSQHELPVADLTYNEKLEILCGLRLQAARTFLKLKF